MNRLPLRLESTELIVYGTVDPAKMWETFADEDFEPILVDGKAIVTIWFNNFTDTDCGGSYLETWYNTFVTRKGNKVELPKDIPAQGDTPASPFPFSCLAAALHPASQSFLQRVLCGDREDNPGAAMKAITGGREIFGFPKHPDPATISHVYEEKDGVRQSLTFECDHHGKKAVSMHCTMPELLEPGPTGYLPIPVEVAKTKDDACIGAPRHGGTHKGHNGAHQSFYATSLKCTQNITVWNAETDTLTFGDNEHYAPISTWGFVPLLKVHSPDFKICAHRPTGWNMTPEETLAAIQEHEAKIAGGLKAGAL